MTNKSVLLGAIALLILAVIANGIFRSRVESAVPVYVAILVVLAIVGVALLILERRIRAVEVVA